MAGPEKGNAQEVNPQATNPAAVHSDNLAGYVLPDSKWERAKMLAADGASNIGSGMVDAVKYDATHLGETAMMLGTSFGLGLGSKVLLPEGGFIGWAAPAAIGAYFLGTAAKGVYDSFEKGLNAKTSQQFDAAAREIGDAGGSLLVNGAASGIAYGAGVYGGGKLLMSERMDGFANAKANLWGRTDNPLGLSGGVASDGISRAGSVSIASRVKLDGDSAQLLMSNRVAPEGILRGAVDPNQTMDVTVMLKSKATDLQMDRAIARMVSGKQSYLTPDQFAEKFGADANSLAQLQKFATDNALTIGETDMRSGKVVLSGSVGDMSKAFNVRLNEFQHPSGVMFRAREGTITVPKTLANHIEGVFGLDDRPQARSYAIRYPVGGNEAAGIVGTDGQIQPRAGASRSVSYYGNEVGQLYNFPKGLTGKGQGIAFPELGGGFSPEDNAAFFKKAGLKDPAVDVVTVDGAKNAPDGANGASGEVHLDSQVAGAVAPDARQMIVFGPNSDRGFIDTITRATFQEKGETPNTAISISWGGPEDTWTEQGIRGMNMAFKKATMQGQSIFAAAGDDGAMDGSPSKTYQVDFPSSSIWVTGVGGTRLIGSGSTITSEVAWNNGESRGAGGGGISAKFPVPDWQKDLKLPPNANKTGFAGRGVPDVAANGDPVTGYKTFVGGEEGITGGTSAGSPLYGGYAALVGEGLGRKPGFFNEFMYKNRDAGIFNDIVKGNNNGYETGPGWDAVTGLGSINGTALYNLMKNGAPSAFRIPRIIPLIRNNDQSNAS